MTKMEASDMLMEYVHGIIQSGQDETTNRDIAKGMQKLYSTKQLQEFVKEFGRGKCPCGRKRCVGELALAVDECFQWIQKAQIARVDGNNYVH